MELNKEILDAFKASVQPAATFKLSDDARDMLRAMPPEKSPTKIVLEGIAEELRKIDEPIIEFLRESHWTLEELEEACVRVARFWHLIGIQRKASGIEENDLNQVTGFFKDRNPIHSSSSHIPTVAPEGKHIVPLVTYNNGDRREIGEATVSVEGGIVDKITMTLTDEVAQNLGLYVALDSISFPEGATGIQATIQNRMSLKREN